LNERIIKYQQQGSSVYNDKSISEGQKRLFNDIDFSWSIRLTWDERYQQLRAYKAEYGHTRVPLRYEKYPKLQQWLDTQRCTCKNEERVTLLNDIGVLVGHQRPKACTATWEEMYQRLVEYKRDHGDTKVPKKYKEDPQLGTWVHNQRYQCKNEERVTLLNDIGVIVAHQKPLA